MVDNCVKLQISSASIKAGVTSLLDHTIFWANYNQYEFLRSINESVDEVTDLAIRMMLAFRIQANRLEMKIEPQDLNDLLSSLRDHRSGAAADPDLDIRFPSSEAAVLVDYGFCLIALKLIIEVEADARLSPRKLTLTSTPGERAWLLDLEGIQAESIEFLQQVSTHTVSFGDYDHHRADKLLRLILAYWICQLQGVEIMAAPSQGDLPSLLRLAIPAA